MIEQAIQWHRRFYAWQQRGGTPRWWVYMWVATILKAVPALILFFSLLYAVDAVSTDPGQTFQLIGVGSLLFLSLYIVDYVLSPKTNQSEE